MGHVGACINVFIVSQKIRCFPAYTVVSEVNFQEVKCKMGEKLGSLPEMERLEYPSASGGSDER